MKSILTFASIILAAGCIAPDGSLPDPETGANPREAEPIARARQGTAGAVCKSHVCGTNSPTVGDGLLFDEVDSSGQPNRNGMRMVSARLSDGTPVRISVSRHTLTATGTTNGEFYSTQSLMGATIQFRNDISGREYELRIADVDYQYTFWTPPAEHLPLYQIQARRTDSMLEDDSTPDWACSQKGLTYKFGTLHNVYAFQGDIYDPIAKKVKSVPDSDPRFNLACGGTATAKMLLTRHARAGSIDDNNHTVYDTNDQQRTAMLKMLTADYCGTGHAFTVTGQRLAYADAWTEFEGWSEDSELEAVWDARGARCLNTPRRGSYIVEEIRQHCGLPRPCRSLAEEDDGSNDELVISSSFPE